MGGESLFLHAKSPSSAVPAFGDKERDLGGGGGA